jgi:hypothetical protein
MADQRPQQSLKLSAIIKFIFIFNLLNVISSNFESDINFPIVKPSININFENLTPSHPDSNREKKFTYPKGLDLNDLQMHGTTTLSFKFSEGIIIAADSRF